MPTPGLRNAAGMHKGSSTTVLECEQAASFDECGDQNTVSIHAQWVPICTKSLCKSSMYLQNNICFISHHLYFLNWYRETMETDQTMYISAYDCSRVLSRTEDYTLTQDMTWNIASVMERWPNAPFTAPAVPQIMYCVMSVSTFPTSQPVSPTNCNTWTTTVLNAISVLSSIGIESGSALLSLLETITNSNHSVSQLVRQLVRRENITSQIKTCLGKEEQPSSTQSRTIMVIYKKPVL